jgi:dihydrofolate reductase
VKISLMVALSQNGVIGTGNQSIPWHLPRDIAHFRSYTQGKWMLLGRKTYLEMLGWFTGQTPLILTRNPEFSVSHGLVAGSMPEAIHIAQQHKVPELVVCGGAAIYQDSLPWVDTLIMTRVHASISGSVFFPEYDSSNWKLIASQFWAADPENIYPMTFQTFIRRSQPTEVKIF